MGGGEQRQTFQLMFVGPRRFEAGGSLGRRTLDHAHRAPFRHSCPVCATKAKVDHVPSNWFLRGVSRLRDSVPRVSSNRRPHTNKERLALRCEPKQRFFSVGVDVFLQAEGLALWFDSYVSRVAVVDGRDGVPQERGGGGWRFSTPLLMAFLSLFLGTMMRGHEAMNASATMLLAGC